MTSERSQHPTQHVLERNPASLSEDGEVAIRGGAIRVVGYVIGILISLAAAAILVRHLGISGFGRYITVISLIALIGGITEAGIAIYGIREYATRDEPERRQLMADLLGMRLTLTLIGVAGAVCFGLLVGYSDVLILGIVLAGAGLFAQVTADVMSIPLQATLRLGRLTVVELTRRLLALALIGVLAAVGASLLPFLAVPVAAAAGAVALLAFMVRASFTVSASFERRRWRALFAETLPFAMAVSIGAVYFYVTIIVMSVIASELQTGFFGTSFRVTQVALAIPALALTAIFPLITYHRDGPAPDVGDKMGKVFDVAIIFGVWMSLAMALGASFIMDVIAGQRGNGAITVLRIQGLVLTASFVSASSMFGLLALRRYRPILLATSSALVLNVALGLLLIPPLGARGGAIADVVTEILVALGLTITLTQSLPEHRLTLTALPSVILAAALAAAGWLIPVGSVAHVVLATGVYFAVLLALGALPDEVIRAARRVRTQRAPT